MENEYLDNIVLSSFDGLDWGLHRFSRVWVDPLVVDFRCNFSDSAFRSGHSKNRRTFD
jgi:hypothetical protein